MAEFKEETPVSVILLGGGRGSRMQSETPKQYLMLQGKPLILHSFDLFCRLPEVAEIVVVCQPPYHPLFEKALALHKGTSIRLHFAEPGERRQDSVFNGLQALDLKTSYICVHDGVRPFITPKIFIETLDAAKKHGAAAAAMPIKYTLKECDAEGFVIRTVERTRFWEVQTPQMIRKELLEEGFHEANKKNLTLTDDVSFIEFLSYPVKLVEGCYSNLKITTPEDLLLAEQIFKVFQSK